MDKDWVKLSEAGIDCAVLCFYLTVGKQGIKSGIPNQAVLNSPSQQHISGLDISGAHQFYVKTLHQHICCAFGPLKSSQITTNIQQSWAVHRELHPDHFVVPNNKKMDGCPFL